MTMINWNKLAESHQGDQGAGAHAFSGEAEGTAFSLGKTRHLRAAFNTCNKIAQKKKPGSSQWYIVGGQVRAVIN